MSSQRDKSSNRAEQLRNRRNQHSKQRLSEINVARKHGTSTKNDAASKVFSRVKHTPYSPVIKRTPTHVKKRVTIPLKSPGAEINLPSIPIFTAGWRLLSGGLSLSFLVAIILMSTAPSFRISTIQFDGFDRISSNDLSYLLNLNETPVFMADPIQIQNTLNESYPELKDIEVAVSFPADIHIHAQERQPIVSWEYADQTLWIDEEGVVFPPRSSVFEASSAETPDVDMSTEQNAGINTNSSALLTIRSDAPPPAPAPPAEPLHSDTQVDIPFVDTFDPLGKVTPENVDMTIIHAAQTLAEYVNPGTVIVFNQADGLGWSDARGWNVYIGNKIDNIEIKLIEYQAIVDQLIRLGIQPVMISVEHVNAPFFRLE